MAKLWETKDKTSLLISLIEAPGMLNKALHILTSNKVNLTQIQSKPSKFVKNDWREIDFFVDIKGKLSDKNVKRAVDQLNLIAEKVTEVGTVEVPWFPTRIQDLDNIGKKVLAEGDGIQEADHPSFRDPVYR